MLTFFLTIIAGLIALSLVSSIILGVIAIRKKKHENEAYRGRVDKAMKQLRKETGSKV